MTTDYEYTTIACPAPDFEIDPDSTEDFEFTLAADLDGDTIDTVTFVLPDGLTEESSSNTDTTATIFVSGAECGRTYRITCRYTTAGGRSRDKTLRVIGRSQ
jgi:hypothetical protein